MRPQILLSTLTLLLAEPILPAQPLPLPEAVDRYLDAWDLREGDRALPLPLVASRDRAALKWLAAAANQVQPANPFPEGSPSWKEAEGVRRFLQTPKARWGQGLAALRLTESGSYLSLWRWGQPRARAGSLERPLRHLWEDRLLEQGSPGVVRSLSLRHAFCFALAEGDTERFASLLGAPAPVVHLWTLPALESVDLPLSALGGARLRFEMDPGQGLPAFPAGTIWIVPTLEGRQPDASTYLEGDSLEEAKRLIPRLKAAGRTAFLAPSRGVFEAYALMYFPLQIDVDGQGNIQRIIMGDAARARF